MPSREDLPQWKGQWTGVLQEHGWSQFRSKHSQLSHPLAGQLRDDAFVRDGLMLKSHKKTIHDILGRNPIHPFPARMAPGIALEALGDTDVSLRVLDPMAGSGTVLAVARARGHRAIGFDLDPLSVLLSSVWTRTVKSAEVIDRSVEVLRRAKERFTKVKNGIAYPMNSDDETRAFARYWFDDLVRRQLAALSAQIATVKDSCSRDVLWCALSRLIITKSAGASRAMDLSHSRPHREFLRAPVKPFTKFLASVKAIVSNCPQSDKGPVGPISVVKQGDARQLDITSNSIDLVLTSPPYLNAIDYMRCSKFSLVWMGHRISDLRRIRSASVGTEASTHEAVECKAVKELVQRLRLNPSLPPRDEALLSQYAWDMGRAMSEVARVLRPNGRAVYVVGDSTVRGTFVRNSSVVAAVAESHGLVIQGRHSRSLPGNRRYLPPPKGGESNQAMDGRLRREVVLVLLKPGG